jgi:hypothetical protein
MARKAKSKMEGFPSSTWAHLSRVMIPATRAADNTM